MANADRRNKSGKRIQGDMLMAIYSYIITRDYGFAPNPFYGMCTLATCKPNIRSSANVGDWVVGFGSKKSLASGKIIFAMQIQKKITYDEYWEGAEYQCKKPVMNGSLKQNYGDNIYHKVNGEWVQENSHHSLEGGQPNLNNLRRDTRSNKVLIGERFWYFGIEAKEVPEFLKEIIPMRQGHKKNTDCEKMLISWLEGMDQQGFIAEPEKFGEEFQRYDGKS